MITVRASQKIFTPAEVVNLTGICVEHLHNFVRRHRLGFHRACRRGSWNKADQLLFTPWT